MVALQDQVMDENDLAKPSISDRVDKERLQLFNRSKKALRDAAILKAIEDGEIDGSGLIGSDHNEERP